MHYLLILINIVCIVYVLNQIWGKNTRLDETQKLIWTLAAVFAGFLTAIVYYVLFQREKSTK